ncbi:MAG: class A beta-lactamase-related serine hydrolase [Actinobacteria bacterium]|nr:class A beta-lactamase-related serine hydrolase [Actinomycetota bacterium]
MIAYVAKDLTTGACLKIHEEVQLPAYSTIKVLLAAAFWRAVEREEIDEAEPHAFQPRSSVGGGGVLRGFRHAAELALADYAHLMLAVSDNDATNIVAGVVGFDRVNDLAAELGLRQTAMRRLMMDGAAAAAGRDNRTSAADLATLVEELATGETLGAAVVGPVLGSLERQEHLDGIARYLPANASYAGKCGDDSPVGRYAHDCALIGEGEHRVVMAIMTDGAGGFEVVSRTGAALYEALARG